LGFEKNKIINGAILKYIITIFIFVFFFTGCQKNQPITKPQVTITTKPAIVIQKKIIKKTKSKKLLSVKKKKRKKETITTKQNKIALVYASKFIGKYAIEATNSAMVYLLQNKNNFTLDIFDIKNENKNTIYEILSNLKDKNISKVVFMVTPKNADFIFEYEDIDFFNIYLPLVEQSKSNYKHPHIIFGAIDYIQQFNILKDYAHSHIVEIYDDSILGEMLHKNLIHNSDNIISLKLSGKNPNFSYFLKRNNKTLKNSTLILNTPIIKSSIILSQIRANEIKVNEIFSTQLNYTSLLFILTQQKDRKKLLITNSIGKLPKKLEAINMLLENDILYNWVNFSTILGIQYLLNDKNILFDNIKIINNQLQYNINLIDSSKYNFYIKNP
jgi:hypothetical protein